VKAPASVRVTRPAPVTHHAATTQPVTISRPARHAAAPRTHRIKWGQTLTGIARRYGTTVRVLVRLNQDQIKDPNRIIAGHVIRVP
jgi:nucleoid-associated protein YgaU